MGPVNITFGSKPDGGLHGIISRGHCLFQNMRSGNKVPTGHERRLLVVSA
jgi:hypothetical protein